MLFLPWLILLPAVAIAKFSPQYFLYVFLFDIWLLSHPHAVATFFKQGTFKKLSPIVLCLVIAFFFVLLGFIAYKFGHVALFNVYFFTQWFHYMRQNYGITIKHYHERKSFHYQLQRVLLHLVPILALLNLNSKGPAVFFGYYVFFPTFPASLNIYIQTLFALIILVFIFKSYLDYKNKNFSINYFLYFLSNYILYAWAYFYQDNFIYGWLGLTFYHNIQYLIFTWKFNSNYQSNQAFYQFYAIATTLSLLVFGLIEYNGGLVYSAVSIAFVATLTVNFTHYLYDSIIWRKNFSTT